MLAPLLSLLLAVPFAPTLQSPAPEAWITGHGAEFELGGYGDDAGLAAQSVRLEFRQEDAGYSGMEEVFPYSTYVRTMLTFPVEGTRWCWRARHLNTRGEVSDPSVERCFRTDVTPPVSGAIDGGAIVSDGLVALDVQPATDNLSGVRGYNLELAPSSTGPFDSWHAFDRPLPFETFVGEGVWFGQVRVTDNAGNLSQDGVVVPITITAAPSVPTPDAPSFARRIFNGWGDVLEWDAGWMADAGVTHVVASYCNLGDAGCVWRHGFHGYPLASSTWLQLGDEGTVVARIAVVQGGQVGPWSAPTITPLLLDRTAPTRPTSTTSLPAAARMGPLGVSWATSADDFTGLSHYVVQLTEDVSGVTVSSQVNAPGTSTSLTPSGDGRYFVRVAAVDLAGNHSDLSDRATSIIDSTGPSSQRPTATGVGIGATSFVTITWSLPADALSSVSTLELLESSQDGGTQLVSVTGLSTSRVVPAGEWRWQLRGTDSLGNVGLFSEPSNTVLVTVGGVVNGPSITTTALVARCGEPLSHTLEATGTSPLTWSLSSGPSGLEVSSGGFVTWTPPAEHAGTELIRVTVSNAAGSVNGDVQVQVGCDGAPPTVDGGIARQKSLIVGCGCSSFDPLLPLMILALLRRKFRPSPLPLSPLAQGEKMSH